MLLDLGDQRAPARVGRQHGVDLPGRHADRGQRPLHLVGLFADELDVEHQGGVSTAVAEGPGKGATG